MRAASRRARTRSEPERPSRPTGGSPTTWWPRTQGPTPAPGRASHCPTATCHTPIFMPVGTKRHGQGHHRPHQLQRARHAQVVLAQHLPPVACAPARELVAETWAASTASCSADGPIAHRLRRLPGLQPGRDASSSPTTGVAFRSIYDGSKVHWTPEKNMEHPAAAGRRHRHAAWTSARPTRRPRGPRRALVDCSSRWAAPLPGAPTRGPTRRLFGIVQGGMHLDLRDRAACARRWQDAGDVPGGYGIGGYCAWARTTSP